MENGFNTDIAHYYRQLALVEKSLMTQPSKPRHLYSPKTFLKPKMQMRDAVDRAGQKKSGRELKFNKRIESKRETNFNSSSESGLPMKYFQDLNESLINKRVVSNSSNTSKEQSQRVILEICESANLQILPSENSQCAIEALELASEKLKINMPHPEQIKRQAQQVRKSEESTELMNVTEASQQLIAQLVLRNRVYKMVGSRIKNSQNNYERQWEIIWNRYVLYQRLVQKLDKFAISIK